MADYFGHAIYGGVNVGLVSFTYTRTAGISPSVATIRIAREHYELNRWPLEGDLRLYYGPNRIVFPKCRLDTARLVDGGRGEQLVELRILDRRWLWRETEAISGLYNVRRGDEDKILAATEKTPKELATLCLEAMKETGFNLGELNLRKDARPFIDWDYNNPAESLASMAESLGYRPVLGLNDKVKLVRAGIGKQLPRGGLRGDAEVDPPDVPGQIVILGDRIHYQIDVPLEPVALDVNGQIMPQDKVSYAPAGGWSNGTDFDFFSDLTASNLRELAQQWIFRAYRIKVPFFLPGGEKINSLERVLPLLTEQVEYDLMDGRKRFREPWIYGSFDAARESIEPAMGEADPKLKGRPDGLYRLGYSIDYELGIVHFSDHVWKYDPFDDYKPGPADIRLRIAVCVREEKTRGWRRYEFTKVPPGDKRGEIGKRKRYVSRPDVRLNYWTQFEPVAQKRDNTKEVEAAAKYYYESELQKYQTKDSGTMIYAGLQPIDLDGAIQQVTWQIDESGASFTTASRNREELEYTPSYAEKRRVEKIGAAIKDLDAPDRVKADDFKLREFIG